MELEKPKQKERSWVNSDLICSRQIYHVLPLNEERPKGNADFLGSTDCKTRSPDCPSS